MNRAAPIALALVLVPILFLCAKREVTTAGNETSRLATVESLVDHGTFAIEGSRFSTVDKVYIGGHFYSDKPPLLSVWLAGIYFLLQHAAGLGFGRAYHDTLQCLTFLGIDLFSILIAVLSFVRVRRTGAGAGISLLAGASAVLATWVFSYGTTINNHTPAAATLLALESALDRVGGSAAPRHALGVGLLAGILINLELPIGALFSLAGLGWLASSRPLNERAVLAYIAGFACLIGVMLILNWLAHGSFVPAYAVPNGQSYRGNLHSSGVAGLRTPDNPLMYLLEITLGRRGLLSHMPLLILGCIVLFAGVRGGPRTPYVWTAAFGLCVLFYATRSGDFGGYAYGFRFLIPLIPLLSWRAFAWIAAHPQPRRVVPFALALVLGVLTSAVGAYNPWPVAYEGASSIEGSLEDEIRSPFLANLLCFAFEHAPGGFVSRELIERVYGRNLSRRYLALAYANMGRPDLAARLARHDWTKP